MMTIEPQETIRELDPFGFMIGQASAIRPLGGTNRGLDPRYVFHTPYIEFPPCRVIFTIRFDKLQASFGELRVHINAFVPGSGRDAVFVTSSRLDLSDRAAVERGMAISIMAVAGATYAAYGLCMDGTDATAAGLTVTAEQAEADGSGEAALLLPTRLGKVPLDLPTRLIADRPPHFRDPVSQTMTADQLDEAEFRHWTGRLAGPPAESASRWRFAFIAQVLDRYGMLAPGARGITLGGGGVALGPILASAGCKALVGSLPANHGASDFAWSNVLCRRLDAAGVPEGDGAPLALAEMPADERGFDFMWTIGMVQLGHEAGHAANFLLELMSVLRPGGIAIHMTGLTPPGAANAPGLARNEIERLALTLISRRFTVAQLNFAGLAEARETVPFGLVVRKD